MNTAPVNDPTNSRNRSSPPAEIALIMGLYDPNLEEELVRVAARREPALVDALQQHHPQ